MRVYLARRDSRSPWLPLTAYDDAALRDFLDQIARKGDGVLDENSPNDSVAVAAAVEQAQLIIYARSLGLPVSP